MRHLAEAPTHFCITDGVGDQRTYVTHPARRLKLPIEAAPYAPYVVRIPEADHREFRIPQARSQETA